MKKLFVLISALCLLGGAAYAGCGTKVPVEGKLTAYDAEKKELTIGKKKTVTLAASAKVTDAKGKEVKIEDLVGEKVTVSTDKHSKKGESVVAAK